MPDGDRVSRLVPGGLMRPRLQTLIFEVTPDCNHKCLHCYNVWHPAVEGVAPEYPAGELDTPATLRLLAKALDETECRHVTLSGGEPLLRDDLSQILDLLRDRQVATTIVSNGRLLTEATIVDLLNRGVALFELPLLSHRREIHDGLSDSPGAFDAVLAAMARLRHHQGQFVAVFVLTRRNLADLEETIRLAFAFGARGLMLNRFNPGGRGRRYLDELLPTAEEVRQALAVADEAVAHFGLPISCSIPIQPCLVDTSAFPRLGFGFCAAGTDRAYYTLDPLGNLRPCNHSPTILGNLLQERFSDLTAAERMAPFLGGLPARCFPCSLRDACRGGCRAAAQVCSGSLAAEDPFLARNRWRSDFAPAGG